MFLVNVQRWRSFADMTPHTQCVCHRKAENETKTQSIAASSNEIMIICLIRLFPNDQISFEQADCYSVALNNGLLTFQPLSLPAGRSAGGKHGALTWFLRAFNLKIAKRSTRTCCFSNLPG